jgi:hypothetical protein
MFLQSKELAEFGSNLAAYFRTYWPIESAFTNEVADRQASEMSLLANGFLLLGQEFDEKTSAMFCLLWPCHFGAPGAPVGSRGEALSEVRRPKPE